MLSPFEHELSIIRPQDVRMVASIHRVFIFIVFVRFAAANIRLIFHIYAKIY